MFKIFLGITMVLAVVFLAKDLWSSHNVKVNKKVESYQKSAEQKEEAKEITQITQIDDEYQ
jgi:hypothetical protein